MLCAGRVSRTRPASIGTLPSAFESSLAEVRTWVSRFTAGSPFNVSVTRCSVAPGFVMSTVFYSTLASLPVLTVLLAIV